jgi:hypothetical protein
MTTSNARIDYAAGSLVVAIGGSVVVLCSDYRMGSLTSMGPGFFPTLLGVILILLGLALIISAPYQTESSPQFALNRHNEVHFNWRGFTAIIISLLIFIGLADYAGFLPASFFSVFIAALGDRNATIKGSLILAICISIFAVILFSYILHVDLPILRMV